VAKVANTKPEPAVSDKMPAELSAFTKFNWVCGSLPGCCSVRVIQNFGRPAAFFKNIINADWDVPDTWVKCLQRYLAEQAVDTMDEGDNSTFLATLPVYDAGSDRAWCVLMHKLVEKAGFKRLHSTTSIHGDYPVDIYIYDLKEFRG